MNYLRAINSLRKGSAYTAMSDKYEDIIWQDKNTNIPTKKECEDELKRLEEEDKKTQYQRDRKYPDLGEQFDLLFKDIDSGKVSKDGGFYKAIKAVKDAHPKPSE
jgi:hypothetical protein|tara:strand:- start:1285 stop:1599 length:315 start_codon:yes stop_codon:yes gene_type:complete